MIGLKFFDPRIDRAQLMAGYDRSTLARMKEILCISDMWVTYSWGFSDTVEQEDRAYLRNRLGNFRALGIRTHAYVQGMNLVHAHHPDPDLYCRDRAGKLIPYHRGRKLCCPNSPTFRRLLLARVEAACKEDVDGIFIDNLYMGQFPVPVGKYLTDFGCHCSHCLRLFKAYAGHGIPRTHQHGDPQTDAYVRFRSESLHGLLSDIRSLTSKHGKALGSNGLDQSLDTRLFYGYDAGRLSLQQDYLLFENFNHPLTRRSNHGLVPLIRSAGVPVCAVSYRKVIGRHAGNAQRDIDAVFTESRQLGYVPVYKTSEFTTGGVWHNLSLEGLRPPQDIPLPPTSARESWRIPLPMTRAVRSVICGLDRPLLERVYERRRYRRLFGWLIDSITMRQCPDILNPAAWMRALGIRTMAYAALRSAR